MCAERMKDRGNKLFNAREYERAIACYQHAIRFNDSNPVFYNNMASALAHLERNEEAMEKCARAIELNCDYVKAYQRRGLLNEKLGRWADALYGWSQQSAKRHRLPFSCHFAGRLHSGGRLGWLP